MHSKYPSDWDKRRLTVFKRDQWECRGCEFTPDEKNGEGLHAHHVTPISEGGGHSLDNLMTLCEDCHVGVHSSSQEGPKLTPIEMYSCVRCDDEFPEGDDYRGSYCTERCWLMEKADKAINALEYNGGICATCYTRFPPSDDICPRCGNWDAGENHRDELGDVQVDVQNLIAALINMDVIG